LPFQRRKEYLAKALSLNDHLAEAQNDLALIAYQFDWDWLEAEKRFREAIALKPSLQDAHNWYARFLSTMGRFEEGASRDGAG
jgi:Tfp pilus assembly protein PilF